MSIQALLPNAVTIAGCYRDGRSILSIGSAEFRSNLAYSSWRVSWWAWPMMLVVYTIGVLGSLWQVSMGISQGWVAAAVNGAVFVYAARPVVRRAYMGN